MSSRDVIALVGDIREAAHRFIAQELNARGLAGLAPSHGAILSALFRDVEIRMTDLAARIRRDKSTVTVLVRKLERHGYVEKLRDPDDSRGVRVRLAARGRALEPVVREISDALLERTYRGFTTEEKEALIASLGAILRNWRGG